MTTRLLDRSLIGLLGALSAAMAQASDIPPAERRSGSSFMAAETRAMQNDDVANPGMLWVLDGATMWKQKSGNAGKSCFDCHGEPETMRGVAARYPIYDSVLQRPIDLSQRINICREQKQNASRFAAESKELLSLTALIAKQSRGMPIAAATNPELAPFRARGREVFTRRQGQLNLSCSNCHDDNWGKPLAGNTIPQAHPTGYPVYRLEWQSLGSLQRRFRNCMNGIRAEPYPYGSEEFVDLELYLMSRAKGMPVESPAVRP